MEKNMAWLVYLKWNGKVTAQKWENLPDSVWERPMYEVLDKYELKELDMHARLDWLMEKYPYRGE